MVYRTRGSRDLSHDCIRRKHAVPTDRCWPSSGAAVVQHIGRLLFPLLQPRILGHRRTIRASKSVVLLQRLVFPESFEMWVLNEGCQVGERPASRSSTPVGTGTHGYRAASRTVIVDALLQTGAALTFR